MNVLGHPTPSPPVASAYGINVQIIPAPSLHVAINGRPFQNFGTAFASVSTASVLHSRYHDGKPLIQLVPPLLGDTKKFKFTLISCVWRLILAGHVLKRV